MEAADERAEFLHQNYGINHVTATVEEWIAVARYEGYRVGQSAERKAIAERIAQAIDRARKAATGRDAHYTGYRVGLLDAAHIAREEGAKAGESRL